MGYLMTVILLWVYFDSGATADNLLISAALFAIAGAISSHD
ncbi:hypothetical protein [Anaerostipes hominis (ex Lee et al. 2021)]|nr:hypothetical protein [Anaerostipes hominis (ex Lee et al. 2021)]